MKKNNTKIGIYPQCEDCANDCKQFNIISLYCPHYKEKKQKKVKKKVAS